MVNSQVIVSQEHASSRSVVEWDRAVGLCLNNAVVLAAHHLEICPSTHSLKEALVSAMTGEVPASAEKALRALTGKLSVLAKDGFPRLTVEKAAEFVSQFNTQTKLKDFTEFLVVGRDWDEEKGDFVPCLSYGSHKLSFNPPETCCTGSGSIISQSILDKDMLFKKDMPVDEAVDVALRAIYFAAFSKGRGVEAVDVCVATAETIVIKHYDVEDLHAAYAPMVQASREEIRRKAELRKEAELLRRKRLPSYTSSKDLVDK